MPTPAEQRLNELAHSMHHNPGVYAILLGAGISMAAQVPSAWEIVRTLIREKAQLEGVDPLPEGEALDQWYQDTYGTTPDYSTLIEGIEPTIHGQRNLLQNYFEPTDEDREQGRKQPTQAHHAIAQLAKEGFIRIIVTTNFDQLMEQALDAAGVPFFTITSTEEIPAAEPYAHGGVFLIKVHGDYRKANVRNSNEDLRVYPGPMRELLCRIFDEFGLITCGWSGTWDHALRECIEHSPNRRYMLYWSSYNQPSQVARDLIQNRRGRVIEGMGADVFFTQLESKVLGLKNAQWTAPQTLDLLEAEVKLCMTNLERYRIRLQDLLESEADRYNQDRMNFQGWSNLGNPEDQRARLLQVLHFSHRVQRIQQTLLKYDHQAVLLDLWERSFLRRIQMDPGPGTGTTSRAKQMMRVSMVMFTLHFFSHAVQHEQWKYIKRFMNWNYLVPRRDPVTIFELLIHANESDDLIRTVLGERHPTQVRYLVFRALLGEDFDHWTLEDRPQAFYFLLGEMVYSLLAHAKIRGAGRGLYLWGESARHVGRGPFHQWIKDHEAALADLVGGDLPEFVRRFEEASNGHIRSSSMPPGGLHEDLSSLFPTP